MNKLNRVEDITCDICKTKYDYTPNKWVDDGIPYESVDEMPDGYFIGGLWVCDACGSCPNCGKALEKRDDNKRAYVDNLGIFHQPKLCIECEEEINRGVAI